MADVNLHLTGLFVSAMFKRLIWVSGPTQVTWRLSGKIGVMMRAGFWVWWKWGWSWRQACSYLIGTLRMTIWVVSLVRLTSVCFFSLSVWDLSLSPFVCIQVRKAWKCKNLLLYCVCYCPVCICRNASETRRPFFFSRVWQDISFNLTILINTDLILQCQACASW